MTDFGRRAGDMFKSVYDTDDDGKVEVVESQISDLDHDADKIKGVTVDDSDVGDGKRLTFVINPNRLIYQTPTAGGPLDAIRGDGTADRYLRGSRLYVLDGTNANTLKCTVTNRWNGDGIAQQDNIARDAITGYFYLNAAGTQLTILNAGLTGSALYANTGGYYNTTGPDFSALIARSITGILIATFSAATGAAENMTVLVETGYFTLEILYITDG